MVKSSRSGEPRFEVNTQANLLARQFSKSVCLGGGRIEAPGGNVVEMLDLGSSSSSAQTATGFSSFTSSSAAAATPADEAPSEVEVSRRRFSTVGFEVDITGSQKSDTPFLRMISRSESYGFVRKRRHGLYRPKRSDGVLEAMKERFEQGMAARLNKSLLVDRLLRGARDKLLKDLSFMAPESIEQSKMADPSGGGELVWSVLQSSLEGEPNLMAFIKLTTPALSLIASHKSPIETAIYPPTLLLCAVVVYKMDPQTYRDVCRYLFPVEDRFWEGSQA